jgi:hypothetical protein
MGPKRLKSEMITQFEELRQACEEVDDDAIRAVVAKLKSEGIRVTVREDSSSVEFDNPSLLRT